MKTTCKSKIILVVSLLAVMLMTFMFLSSCQSHKHAFGEWVVTEADCVNPATQERVCECGEKEQQVIEGKPALGHAEGEWVVDTEATCTSEGSKHTECTRCSAVVTIEKIEKSGHTEVVDAAVAATCIAPGKTEGKHCSVCNEVIVAQTEIAAKAHTEVKDAAVEATCATEGKTEGKHCSVCNTVIVAQTTVAKKAHTEVKDAAVAATCTTDGKTEGKHCSVCKTVIVAQTTVAKKGHTEVVDAAVAATCTADGKTEGKHCSVCNTVIVAQTTVAKKGHTEVVDEAVAATCTADGKTEGKHCSVCKEVLVAQTMIAATGHEEVAHEAKAPTCTEPGNDAYVTCAKCDYTTYKAIDALGHKEVVSAAVAATCTTEGKTEGKVCSVCNTVLAEQTVIEALGHDEVAHEGKLPTCTENGYEAYVTCSRCDYTTYKEIVTLGHTMLIYGTVEPTCTKDGYTSGSSCMVCGIVFESREVLPALGHTEVIVPAVDATCMETGMTEGKYCSVCDVILLEQTVIPAKGHTEVTDPAVEPTCTVEGKTEGSHCSACGEVFVAQKAIAAKGHTEVIDAGVEPTCTIEGKTEGKHCGVCGEVLVLQTAVAAKGHTAVVDAAIEATCVSEGKTEGSHCSVCGDTITKQEVVAKKAHEFKNYISNSDATCLVDGTKTAKCENCDATETLTDEGSAVGHKCEEGKWSYNSAQHYRVCTACGTSYGFAAHDAEAETCICGYKKPDEACTHNYTLIMVSEKPATCTTDGNKGYFICPNCQTWFEEVEAKNVITDHVMILLPAKGHTEFVEKPAVEATCAAAGSTAHIVCSSCQIVLDGAKEIEALPHTPVVDKAVEANCVNEGKTEGSHCEVCSGVIVAQQTIPATGKHDFVIDKNTLPSCTVEGYTSYKCENCPEVKETIVSATGHSIADDAVWTVVSDAETGKPILTLIDDAKCLYEGNKATNCSTCGEEITEKYTVVEHQYVGAITTAATCQSTGVKTYSCKNCDNSYTEPVAVDTNAHVWTAEAVEGKYTCTVTGCTSVKVVVNYTEESTAGLNKDTLESAKDTDLEVNLKDATIKIDSDVVNELGQQGDDVDLSADKVDESKRDEITNNMDDESKELLGDKPIYDFNLTVNDEKVEFNGTMTVTLPYVLGEGEDPDGVVVAYIDDEGNITIIPATYSNGYVTFVTDHFSHFTPVYLTGEVRCKVYGHNYYDVEVKATCLTAGYTNRFCHYCGAQDPEVYNKVPANGHNYKTVVTTATCKAQGYTTYTCVECGYKYVGDYTDIADHTLVIDKVIAATCSDEGYSVKKCSLCSYTKKVDFVEALGHSWGEAVVTKEANCTEQGVLTSKCIRENCSEEKTATVSALGHKSKVLEAVKPTCTENGRTQEVICSVCNEILIPADVIAASGHMEQTIFKVEPTCTTVGNTEGRKCAICGDVVIAIEIIPALGHKEVVIPAIAATCTEAGKTDGKYCSVCEETLKAVEEILPFGHNFVDGKCSACGKLNVSVGLAFQSNGDGTCRVIGIGECTDTDIIIPSVSPAGDKVTMIVGGAFMDTEITSVVVPDGVITIAGMAFANAEKLESITLPDTLLNIMNTSFDNTAYYNNEENWDNGVFYVGKYLIKANTALSGEYTVKPGTLGMSSSAFRNCKGLTAITIPDSITTIGVQVFQNCASLASVSIPDSVTTIDNYAFSGCTALTSVTIPDSVTSIGSYAFAQCSTLESIVLGNGVETIGNQTFRECKSLKSIELPKSLISIGDSVFYNCTSLESVTIPDSVTTISNYAFSGCTALTSVIIPESVTTIGNNAFYNCTNLATVELGDNITDIGYSPFKGTAFYNNTENWEDNVLYIGKYLIAANTSITSCNIKDGTTVVAARAFMNCSKLMSVTIPESVVSIGTAAFYNSSNLNTITLAEGNKNFTIKNNCLIDVANKTLIRGFGDCSIPTDGSVTSIGEYAFYRCTTLTNVVIPDSITSIGASAFSYCTKLESVVIPNSVKRIENYTFEYCSSLTSVTIPDSVTYIGTGAFRSCKALTSIVIPASVTSTGSTLFDSCSMDLVIFCKATEQPKGWSSSWNKAGLAVSWGYVCDELGHDMAEVAGKAATCTEPGYNAHKACTRCVTKENYSAIAPLGHNEVSKVNGNVIENTCSVCGNVNTIPLSTVVPDMTAMKEYINANGYLFLEASFDEGFKSGGSLTGIGSMSAVTRGNGKIQMIPRYSLWTLKDGYYSVEYAPQNCTNNDSVHTYVNVWNTTYSKQKGKTFIFEFSVRPNENTFAALTVQALERFTKSPYTVNMLNIKENGEIVVAGDVIYQIDVTNKTDWTRIAVAIDAAAHTYTVYVNGLMGNAIVIDDIPTSFPYVQEWRINVGTQNKSAKESQGVDLDEFYSYVADYPSYITGVNNCDTLGHNMVEVKAREATCTKIGWTAHTSCTRCGEKVGYTEIAALGHKIATIPAKEATCDLVGYSEHTACSICGGEKKGYTEIPATGHKYGEDKICTVCGNRKPSEGLAFSGNYVTGIGTCTDTDIVIPAVTPDGKKVVGINGFAFENNTTITSVVIPEGVTELGYAAFRGCTGIKSVTLPSSIKVITGEAFRECTSLTSVVIPEGVTSLEYCAFNGCTNLSDIVIPTTITSVGMSVFNETAFIAKYKDDALYIGNSLVYANVSALSVKDGITNIISGSIMSNVKTLNIPASVTNISSIIWDANNIESITVAEDNKVYYSEGNCIIERDTKTVVFGCQNSVIPNGIEAIGDEAFAGCVGLKSIVIPEGVRVIGDYAFSSCNNLASVVLPESVTEIGNSAFALTRIATITIPSGVTSIGRYTFQNCSALKSIIIPNGVTTIGDYAFSYCINLESVTIPASVTSIGRYAFRNCTALTSIVIPESVTTMGDMAFYNSKNLTICCKAASQPEGWNAKWNASNCSVVWGYVCDEKGHTYVDGKCSACGVAAPCEHKWELSKTVKASCTVDGYDWYVCATCGDTEQRNLVKAYGHKYEFVSTIAPTCVKVGGDQYRCVTCKNTTIKNTIPVIAHTIVTIPAKEATCDLVGYSEHKACSVCGGAKEGYTEIAALGHKYDEKNICTVCGNKKPSEGLVFRFQGGTQDGVKYQGYLVSGIGTCTDTEIVIPSVTPDGNKVVGVYSGAFQKNTNITSVVIPEGATIIMSNAFSYCTALTSVVIPESVEGIGGWAFNGCTALADITIGKGVKAIGNAAFTNTAYYTNNYKDGFLYLENYLIVANISGALEIKDGTTFIAYNAIGSQVTSLIVPASVTNISERVCNNNSIESITVAEGNKIYHSENNCIIETATNTLVLGCKNSVIPEGVISIGEMAFSGSSIASVTIPESVTIIDMYAFQNCDSLKSITIPASVTDISIYAFTGCDALESITVSKDNTVYRSECNCIITIKDNALYIGCKGSVIPEGVTVIGNSAFEGCSALTSVVIPSSVKTIGEWAFSSCGNLTNVTISEGVTSIGRYTFQNCSALKSIVIPNGVTTIGDYAFSYCSNLESVTIPGSVTSIGRYAFRNCTALTSIVIPESVTTMGDQAFYGSKNLTIYCKAASQPSGWGAKWNASNCSVVWGYVCDEKGHTYVDGKCSACGVAAPCEHKWELSKTVKASCTVDGYDWYVCATCGDTEQRNLVKAYGHKYEFVSTIAPTCVKVGGDQYRCATCKSTTMKNIVPVIAHTIVTIPAKEATCDFVGYTEHKACSVCGGAKEGYTEIAALGHKYDEKNICTVCKQLKPSEGLAFSGNYVSGIGDCQDTDIVIPAVTPDGVKVLGINSKAFSNNSTITSVVIPDGVTSINSNAFSYCKALTSVVIPDSVTTISSYAFNGCTALADITIGKGVKSIGINAFNNTAYYTNNYKDGVLYIGNYLLYVDGPDTLEIKEGTTVVAESAIMAYRLKSLTIPASLTNLPNNLFVKQNALESITVAKDNPVYHSEGNCVIETATNKLVIGCANSVIPEGVTTIGNCAFCYCTGLTSIVIPEGVTTIGNNAFEYCRNLKDITIPASVTSIGNRAFYETNTDKTITVKDGNKAYYSEGNCLINASTKELIVGSNSSVIPEGVTSIGQGAFKLCNKLTSIVIPSSVTTIGEHAFTGCTSLTSIIIPESVTSITGSAFYSGCENLTIYCKATSQPSGWKSNWNYSNCPVVWGYVCDEKGHTEVVDTAIAATCTTAGKTEGKHCSVCNTVIVAQTTIAASHNYVDGVCSVCKALKPSEGLAFTWFNGIELNGVKYEGYFVTGSADCTDTDVVIPSVYEGKPVIGIDYNVFKANTTITSVVIPESVILIDRAFTDCSNLATITVGTNVQYIQDRAFAGTAYYNNNIVDETLYLGNYLIYTNASEVVIKEGTTYVAEGAIGPNVKSIVFPASLRYYITAYITEGTNNIETITVSKDNPYFYAEGNCLIETATKTLVLGCKGSVIPEGVTSIADCAFYKCSGLTSAVIPEGVTRIGFMAFDSCSSLKIISIPSTVTFIDGRAFFQAGAVETITVAEGNKNYYSEGNCLIEMETMTLLKGCNDSVIPAGVKKLDYGAFANCDKLTTIVIPDSVTSIGSFVFSGCSKLTTVIIPKDVTYIGPGAFRNMTIYCKVDSQPEKWNADWNYKCTVVWGYVCDEKGHTEVVDTAIAATCTTAGKTEGKHCSVCNTVIVAQAIVPVADHTYVDGVCSACGSSEK